MDTIYYVCETCSEEYELPETYNEECPICGCDTLYPIDIEASNTILNDYMERVLKEASEEKYNKEFKTNG